MFAIKKYDKVLCLTNEDYEDNWHKWPTMEVMPNPCPFKSNSPSSCTNKTIISTGRLDPLKDFALLIRAFASIADKHKDWILEIYGDGPERQHLEGLIKSLSLGNRVFLRGYEANVRQKLEQAGFFAFSSRLEGFPLSLIEAMGCGLPVVSTQCKCGPKDIITPGKDGFLVAVGDEKALAEKLSELMSDEALRKRMGTEAVKRADDFSITTIIKRQMNLFSRLTERRYEL